MGTRVVGEGVSDGLLLVKKLLVTVLVGVSTVLELVVRVWARGVSGLLLRILLVGCGVRSVNLKGVLWGSEAGLLLLDVRLVVIVGGVGELLRVDV